ncbi:MAG: exo-alpha-sialidase, partial [Muribaculaceae bacterium]|nr:exo-alpha-sialidase [Muribaculaceae bacterium]
MSNYAVYSDDHGATWQVSTNSAYSNGDEAKIVELENGDLLMSIKNRSDLDDSNVNGYRLMAKSTDQGVTWTTATVNSYLMDPACNGDVVSTTYGGTYYLLHSLPASTSTRENVTIYISSDNGQTWPISKQVYSGYSAYSSLEVLNDGTIGIIVEEGKWDSNLPGSDGFNLKYYNYSMASLLGQAVDVETSVLITEAKELLNQTGVGYPSDEPRATLQSAIAIAEANPNAEAGVALQTAINAYKTTTDIVKPETGKTYIFINKGYNSDYYIWNNGGTLSITQYTEGTTEIPASAKFTCEVVDGEYKYMFRTSDGKYMAFPSLGKTWLDNKSEDGVEDVAG